MITVKSTDYSTDPPTDISIWDMNNGDKKLVVCARQGQETRLLRLQSLGLIESYNEIRGWWTLLGLPISYIDQFPIVYLLDPDRISDPLTRQQWLRLVNRRTEESLTI